MIQKSRFVVTGGTGNTGSHVLSMLYRRNPQIEILALVRQGSDTNFLRSMGVSILELDFSNLEKLKPHLRQDDILLEMANMRFACDLLSIFAQTGTKRAFCVTTTAIFSKFHSYSILYHEIEQNIKKLPIETTILRPSMIYGNERDHNMHKLLLLMSLSPIFPVFGSGAALMQPVHVIDLAMGIVSAVEKDVCGEFNLAGPSPIPYNEILKNCADALERNILFFHVVHGGAAFFVRFLEKVPGFPLKYEQIMRLVEDKAFNIENSQRILDYQPRDFRAGVFSEVERLREIKVIV